MSRRAFPAISGMSVYADNLVRELVARGHDVTLIAQYRDDAFGKAVYGGGPPPGIAGARVVGREQRGEQDGGDFERDVSDLVATIRAEHARAPFDVLHAQYGYPPGWAAVLAASELGTPVVVSIQGGDGHWVGSCCATHRLAMQRTIAHADAVLIGGASFVEEVAARLDLDRALFTIVPGAVDTRRFVPREGAGRSEPVVLFHGRIDRRKGALDFVQACAVLARRGRRFRALLTGIGPDSAAVRDAIAASGVGDRFEQRGYVAYDDVPLVYREADVFASPTYAEGFSNTILEAMASGLAIVAGRSVGVIDCLNDGEDALLVDPGDVDGLVAAFERVLADAPLRARLAARALDECRATYGWDRIATTIEETYRASAARGTTRALGVDPRLPVAACRFRAEPHLL